MNIRACWQIHGDASTGVCPCGRFGRSQAIPYAPPPGSPCTIVDLTTDAVDLARLRGMGFDEARRLPLPVRDALLDQLLSESRKILGQQPERQVGLMSDVVEEDLESLAKLGAVRLVCGGFIPVDASGEVPSDDPEGQFRLVFENVRASLAQLGTTTDRIISLIVFLRDMGQWALMNRVYRDFITCCPARAAIGIQSLNKNYQIEIVSLVAYRLADTER